MSHPLLSAFRALPDVHHVLDQVGRARLVDVSASDGTRPFLVAALAAAGPGSAPRRRPSSSSRRRPARPRTSPPRSAPSCPADRVAVFPSWETLPHERLSPRSDTVGRRLAVLRRIAHPDPDDTAYGPSSVVVAPVRAVLQPLTKGLGELVPVALRPGDERPLPDVVDALVAAAYTRTDLVERRGEFAVRGGILDVFPPTEEHPVRIEFWGDTVEEVRWFKVADQRSLEVAEHGLWAPPCRELLLTDDVRARARALADQLPGRLRDAVEGRRGHRGRGHGVARAGARRRHGVGARRAAREHPIVLLADPERIRRRAHDLVATSDEFLEASWANAAAGNQVPVDLQSLLGSASYWTLAQVRAHATAHDRSWWTLTPLRGRRRARHRGRRRRRAARRAHGRHRGLPRRHRAGRRAPALTRRRRLAGHRRHRGPRPRQARRGGAARARGGRAVAARWPRTRSRPGYVGVTTAPLGRGFAHEGERLEVVTETDLTGQPGSGTSTKDMRRMPSRRRNQVDPLQLRPGDFVVHEQHGVGRFVEMMQRTVAGATREYLVIEYAPSQAWPARATGSSCPPTSSTR